MFHVSITSSLFSEWKVPCRNYVSYIDLCSTHHFHSFPILQWQFLSPSTKKKSGAVSWGGCFFSPPSRKKASNCFQRLSTGDFCSSNCLFKDSPTPRCGKYFDGFVAVVANVVVPMRILQNHNKPWWMWPGWVQLGSGFWTAMVDPFNLPRRNNQKNNHSLTHYCFCLCKKTASVRLTWVKWKKHHLANDPNKSDHER